MSVFITVQGVIGTEPKLSTWNGQAILTFRMVNNERKYDSATRAWVDVHASWLRATCFGELAHNARTSLRKGDRVLVHGKMRVKDYVTSDGVERTGVDVVVDAIGPDLRFAVARVRPARRPGDSEERLREHADRLQRELDGEPRLSMTELIAQRAAHPDEDEEFDEEFDEVEEADTDEEHKEGETDDGRALTGDATDGAHRRRPLVAAGA